MIGSFKQMNEKRLAYESQHPGLRFEHPIFKSVWLSILGSILSGLFLAMSFPKAGHSTLAFAALVPLMFAVHTASLKKAMGLSLLAGFVFFLVSLSWLSNLIGTVEGVGLKASALLGYGVLALYCALYFVPFGLTIALGSKEWAGDNLTKNLRLMFSMTMVWVGAEYLRGFLFTGFPWNPLGLSQYANPSIIQVAEWGGVSMVSAYIVWMNAGIFLTLRQYSHGLRSKKYRPHFELMLGIMPIALAVGSGMNVLLSRTASSEVLNVALVQPNIEQVVKWDREKDQKIRQRLEGLTSAALRLPELDLVIWPETALPDFVRSSALSVDLVKRMTERGVPLLVGSMDREYTATGKKYYNSSMLFGKDGVLIGKYDKQHLVPFGEYVPFPGLMGKFTPVDLDFQHGTESTLLPLNEKGPFSVLICFEDIVAPLAVNAVRNGARWLVSQSNDAWFDPSGQSEQHLAHAVFRCIENRVPMTRCCNTGVSAVIDAYGNVQRDLAPRTKGFTIARFSPRPSGARETFYTRHGNLFSKVSLLLGAMSLFVLRRSERKRRKAKNELDNS